MKCLLLIFSMLPAFAGGDLFAGHNGKIPLNHSVYDDWRQVRRQQLSNDGRWASYEIQPQQGDGWLYLKNLQTRQTDSMARGHRAAFAPGSDFFAYRIAPPADSIRQARAEGRSRDEMPAGHLVVRRLFDADTLLFKNVRSFSIAGTHSAWMAIQKEDVPQDTLNGAPLIILNPVTREKHRFPNVTDHFLSDNGRLVLFLQDIAGNGTTQLVAMDTDRGEAVPVLAGEGRFRQLSADKEGYQAAFLYSGPAMDPPVYTLYHYETENGALRQVAGPDTPGIPGGWSPGSHSRPRFSDDGKRLFFGTAPIPAPEPEDTLLPEERHSVDIWHYADPLIQPMQLVQKEDELKRTYAAVYHIREDRTVQLAGETMPDLTPLPCGSGQYALGESKLPYLIPNSFESGDYRDVYLVDLTTGERTLVLEQHRGSVHLSSAGDPRLSPGGKYLLYYDQGDRHWHARPVADNQHVRITGDIPYPLYDELHDAPGEPDPHGIAGWIEDDRYVLVYDRFDIWRVDPSGREKPVSLTNGYGRNNAIRFRYVDLDPDRRSVGTRERIMLSAFDTATKQSGFFNVRAHQERDPEKMVLEDVRYFRPQKAGDAEVLLWQKSTFATYPDLWVSDMFFNNPRRISFANPQQEKYKWGTAELVEWVSFANDTLQGLLYLPEELVPGKKYPMIVYFYERSSDGLHMHQVPSPSRSTINRSYCVSNGYIVFVPDIRYRTGYPGQSAYDAIVSGTKAMLNQYPFIDRENLGLQGQSWAGYQIAWLITRTDMFRAAMAGAPVSNMVSAYGGIRWVTGMSRIYQYEETQSRIGGTLWDKTMQYIENSPVFYADRVNTPLLMMHNDADGAVPWYQGIEYFMALRRLGKPVWMLNYNDEAHNLTRRPNMTDLTIRMYQFFDHYLKGEPAPVWMKEGIPAIRKGIDDGYRLVE